jgi:hypothetical protein
VHSQGLAQQQLDWLDIVDDWAIECTHFIVRCRVRDSTIALTTRRYLFSNEMTGTVPTTIGQLTALSFLYVVLALTSFPLTFPQVVWRQQFDWNDPLLDLVVDGSEVFVSIARADPLVLSSPRCVRSLQSNQLTGAISPLVEQLTALTSLYGDSLVVCNLTIAQAIGFESVDRHNTAVNLANGKPRYVVSWSLV